MRTVVIHLLIGIGITRYFFQLNPDVDVNAANAFLVFIATYWILWLLSFFYDSTHFRKLPKAINLFFYFLKELMKANMRIAYEVVTPGHRMKPGVIVYPMKAETDLEITLLASLISLTPGTLTIDVSPDRKYLYFHSMDVPGGDMQNEIRALQNGFEKKILELTR